MTLGSNESTFATDRPLFDSPKRFYISLEACQIYFIMDELTEGDNGDKPFLGEKNPLSIIWIYLLLSFKASE